MAQSNEHNTQRNRIMEAVLLAPAIMELYRALKGQGLDIRDAFEMTKTIVVEIMRKDTPNV